MKPKVITFDGRKYTLSGRYYRRNVWGSDGPTSLHRAIWESHHGPIPEGHEVHHKDEDTLNNVVSNLECLPASDHQRQHMLERIARGEMKPPSDEARAKAAEWHASPAGLEWHRENGKKTWANREWHAVACVECGTVFQTPYPNKSKYCHNNCKQMQARRRAGKPVGTRPGRTLPRVLAGKRKPE